MSYLVLARKYRPQKFSEVFGQQHVCQTLTNAISRNQVAHAYIFAGLRGTGKTSIARIFAKELNCANKINNENCGQCVCAEIASGRSLAVIEIDGASNNSVENVRELIESFRSVPPLGYQYKVYIIDEVHMLSTSAFNALLKSLEEPPINTVFILATTELHKIPDTVISRCQVLQLRALYESEIIENLAKLGEQENLKISESALLQIARAANGSLRDAQSHLDRVKAFSSNLEISEETTVQALGLIKEQVFFGLSKAIFENNTDLSLELLEQVFSSGANIELFLRELTRHFRELLLVKVANTETLKALGLTDNHCTNLKRLVATINISELQSIFATVRKSSDLALRSNYPKYTLEAMFVRLTCRSGQTEEQNLKNSPENKVVPISLAEKDHNKLVDSKQFKEFDSQAFLNFISKDAKLRMLAEQLKRCELKIKDSNILQIVGNSFNLQYFQAIENKKKIEELLTKFDLNNNWVVNFVINDPSQTKVNNLVEVIDNELAEEPIVQALKKAFPKSEVKIKLKSQ